MEVRWFIRPQANEGHQIDMGMKLIVLIQTFTLETF